MCWTTSKLDPEYFSKYSDGLQAERPGFGSRQSKISLFSTPSIPAPGS
jgi:hypothetical protein